MDLTPIAQRMRSAKRMLFITGAGLSADSGLPTYRGVGGLYNDRDAESGMPIEVALSGDVFAKNPAITWRHIRHIEQACRNAAPNDAHHIIAKLQNRCHVTVLTQNVDGFHMAAGSKDIIDIHGDVHRLRCTACNWRDTVTTYAHLDTQAVPRCPKCQSVIRPDVVLFGEMLDPNRIQRLQDALDTGFDMVFSIGTTSVFPYIALPVIACGRAGAMTIEINPGHTEVSHAVHHKIPLGAAHTLRQLEAALIS